jgi:Rrf2 family transcriptional regulator, cysteine metabolism repressor
VRFSKKAEYALRAMTELAMNPNGGSLQAQELARREQISVKFLEQILRTLTKAGLLQSRRGAGGGYVLTRSPDRISLGEVLRLVDGPLDLLECAAEQEPSRCSCGSAHVCGLRSVVVELRASLAGLFEGVTLADICTRTEELRRDAVPIYSEPIYII